MTDRYFFHSFPRPKPGETPRSADKRALAILSFMKDAGLVLAPELVEWDVREMSGGDEQFTILQQRACFTELSLPELPAHSGMFGPIALACDIARLRTAGAVPVIYVPQALSGNPLSMIATFAVRGAWHTRAVLKLLHDLEEAFNPQKAEQRFGYPLAPEAVATLQNKDPNGNIVATYAIPAQHIHQFMLHVGYRAIPFPHSIGVLGLFLNMFYPTDNMHSGDLLGYYRQREWRLVGSDIQFNQRPFARQLTDAEAKRLIKIDPQFWTRELTVDGQKKTRVSLALIYDPIPEWQLFDFVQFIAVPERLMNEAGQIVGRDRLQSY